MYLKEIETRPPQGAMKLAFSKLSESGQAIPEILHLFRFKKSNTDHLVRFTEGVMRGPSPLSPGMRELIGTFVSARNQCCFCSCAHAPVAAHLLGQDLVNEVLRDFETSRLDSKHKALFRYLAKLAENSAQVTASDVQKLIQAGWTEEAIYDALTVAAVFKFYNTWNNGAGVQEMTAADYVHSGKRLINAGYCMDFSFSAILRILWVYRKEVSYADFKELAWISVQKLRGILGNWSKESASTNAPTNSAPAASP